MGIDASIYGQIQAPPPVSPLDNAQKVMTLAQLGYQQQQQQIQMQTRTAMMQAYAANTDPQTGQVNEPGVVSFVARVNPMAAQELSSQIAARQKAQAEAQQAKLKAATDAYNITGPAFDWFMDPKKVDPDQRAVVWPNLIADLKSKGVDVSRMDHPYEPQLAEQYYGTWKNMKAAKENANIQANTDNKNAETAAIPTKAAKDWQEARKNKEEADKLAWENDARRGALNGQTNDPAKLVAALVPKEHQAKAFAEIDAAENTKRMSKSIMDSFEKATQENTALKTGFGVVRTPASVLALHQAMQPTFKDMEGTVRQAAMDNTFRNITPAPGDTAKTIEEKRQALQNYLQSKASAPTARAYGIDLSKYDSTSAYQSPSASASSGGSSIMDGNQANASDKPPGTAGGFSLDAIRAELARRKGGKGK